MAGGVWKGVQSYVLGCSHQLLLNNYFNLLFLLLVTFLMLLMLLIPETYPDMQKVGNLGT